MNKNAWITALVVAVIFGGGGYYFGMQSAAASTTAMGAASYAGRTGGYAGRGSAGFAGAGGGATIGTIVATSAGSFTVQMPASTSTTATTGTKIVLFNDSTMVNELESVPVTSLAVGQSVVVTGTANSDGSVTATSIQVRPAGAAGGFGARTGTSATTGQ